MPALGGTLLGGTVIGRSGDAVIAAERTIGQGRTTIIGVDPTTNGIVGHARRAGALAPGHAARLLRRRQPVGAAR